MELPPKLIDLVQNHLGKQALAIQQQQGRGAWIAPKSGTVSYAPVVDLPKLFGEASFKEFASLLEEVKASDPSKQVVVIFTTEDDARIIATVDIV